ncbi:MAG: hypothetical protein L0Y60_07645 [Beijerinckiaceae bacterium]|nr:hypothetical protein [Beijerinckiaceae bacterium]
MTAESESAARNRELSRQRSDRMRKLNADPEFAARNRERARARMRKLNADPEFAARNRERMRKLNADPELAAKRARLNVQIPQWVPRDLWQDFIDAARQSDEIDAARHVRRLKREMEMPL